MKTDLLRADLFGAGRIPVKEESHGGDVVILLTRLNGTKFGINADLIERVEITGDTVVWLIDGTRFVVSESPSEVLESIIEFRGRVLAAAERFAEADRLASGDEATEDKEHSRQHGALRLVVGDQGAGTDGGEG